jgi:hypothetical protein
MCAAMRENKLQDVFLDVDIALRKFLSTAATNCTAERYFSALRRIKTYLLSPMFRRGAGLAQSV